MRWIQTRNSAWKPSRASASQLLSLGVISIVFLTAIACNESLSPPTGAHIPGPPKRGGVLKSAFFTNVRTLDPATGFTTANAALGGLLFDTLMSYDEAGQLSPQLAESYTVSPDGKEYLFRLKRGVLFHDGEELSAEDVVRTFRRTLHPDTPSPASFYDRIEGFKDYRAGKSKQLAVEADGKYHVKIRLSEPDSTFLHVLALQLVAPVCRSAGELWSRDFGNAPCGAGPFKLAAYENGRFIRLTRHSGYWRPGFPHLDGVEWQFLVQSFTQRYKLERNELNYVRELGRTDITKLMTDPRWAPFGEWEQPNTVFGAFMNTSMEPFNNRHLRRAVSFAVNREQIAAVRRGQIVPQYKLVPESIIPSSPGYPAQRFDLTQALEEMRLAGYPFDPNTGQGGYPKTIEYLTLVDSFGQQIGELLQQQLARIGLRIQLKLVGWPTFQALTGRRGSAMMGSTGWHPDFPEASNFFESTLTSQVISDENSQNNAFFSNASLDALMAKARGSATPEERSALYRQAESIIVEEAPWVLTHTQRYYEVTQPYVHGYKPHPILVQHVRGAWIDTSQLLGQIACIFPGGQGRCAGPALIDRSSRAAHAEAQPQLGLTQPRNSSAEGAAPQLSALPASFLSHSFFQGNQANTRGRP